MKTIFENKEQFFAMKAQWAASSKSPKCKSTLEPCDEWVETQPGGYRHMSKGTGKIRRPGWMNAECHIVYNLLRNKPSDRGFTPSTNPNKILSKPDAHKAGLESLQNLQAQLKANGRFKQKGFLKRMQYEAIKKINRRPQHGWNMKWTMEHANRVLDPFGDSFTIDMFLELDLTPKPVSSVVKPESIQYDAINT